MNLMTPKTVRGKLFFAYLVLVVLFTGGGLFVLVEVNRVRSSSEAFFGQYGETEALIISSRFMVDEISNTVLAPPRSLSPEAYIEDVRRQLDRVVEKYRRSLLPPGLKVRVEKALPRYLHSLAAPLRLHRRPIEKMEFADDIAVLCMRQAEKIHVAELVNAIAGMVDSYTDTLLTNDPDERRRFDELAVLIENHPEYAAVSRYPELKEAALAVFASNGDYVQAREAFITESLRLAEVLAEVDKAFHAGSLLPMQQKLLGNLKTVSRIVFLVMVASLILATAASVLLARRIWRPLVAMGDMVERLTDGQLSHRLRVDGEDEVAQIGMAMNRFADQLKETLEQLDNQMAEMASIESNLRKSEEYSRNLSREYQVVLDGISESLVVINQERNIVWSNRQASEEFFSEIDRRPPDGEGAPAAESAYYLGFEQVDLCFETGEKSEEIVRGRDDRYYRVKVFPLLDDTGKVGRVLRVTSNITEQYRLREESERSSRLASLGELSAGVAHEINNPNSLVIINAPIVRDVFEDILPILEEHFEQNGDFQLGGLRFHRMKYDLPLMLKEMHEGGMRIQRIVNDLKNFVRKGEAVDTERVQLNDAAEAAARLTRNLIGKMTDAFTLDLAPNLPGVDGNLVQFEQVVVNLIQNACHALTDRRKGLAVTTRLSGNGRSVELVVRDEGCGIAPEHLKRVTDPFFTTRRKEGGTGLGLSVSKRIVSEHGGSMNISSTQDKGTTVTVSFPVPQ